MYKRDKLTVIGLVFFMVVALLLSIVSTAGSSPDYKNNKTKVKRTKTAIVTPIATLDKGAVQYVTSVFQGTQVMCFKAPCPGAPTMAAPTATKEAAQYITSVFRGTQVMCFKAPCPGAPTAAASTSKTPELYITSCYKFCTITPFPSKTSAGQ